MNKQYKIVDGVKVNYKIEWTDYTWNPVAGCKHACRWQMPDGSTAICYAEAVATRVAQAAYPHGFEHHYWYPQRLDEPKKLKQPAKIFLDSMSDLLGAWVPEEQIQAVFDVCRATPQHTYQLLTKNAPRLEKFDSFPSNLWVGVSAPPTEMHGKTFSQDRQLIMLYRQQQCLLHAKMHGATVVWMSIEPLSFDIAPHLSMSLDWAVIGAASNGNKTYQPERQWVQNVLDYMDGNNKPVFFKGNLEWPQWREDFPLLPKLATV